MAGAPGHEGGKADAVGGEFGRRDEGRVWPVWARTTPDPGGVGQRPEQGHGRPADGRGDDARDGEIEARRAPREEEPAEQELAPQLGNARDEGGKQREAAALGHVAGRAAGEDGVRHPCPRLEDKARAASLGLPAEHGVLAEGLVDRRRGPVAEAAGAHERLARHEQVRRLEQRRGAADLDRAVERVAWGFGVGHDQALDKVGAVERGKSRAQPVAVRDAVRVGERDCIGGGRVHPAVAAHPRALVALADDGRTGPLGNRGRLVSGAVVDDDHLVSAVEVLSRKCFERARDRRGGVASRNDDADQRSSPVQARQCIAMPPEISVVVATHNRSRRLERLLTGLRAQSLDADRFEVVVVDDGSADDTADVLARAGAEWPAMTVITRARAAGPATAREEGWRAATGGVIAFTDDDCVPDPRWLEQGLTAIGENSGTFVQGRTEPDPTELDEMGPFSRTIEVAALHPAFNTCNIFYPRALLEQVGGFDDEAFDGAPGGEDCDLAWRAIATGARPVFEPDALVHHAVDRVGPLGMLRVAARWTTPMLAYARHPELRRDFVGGIFWKRTHYWLARTVLGLLLPARLAPLRNWLMYPYLRNIWARGRVLGGGPLLAPWYVLLDLVETLAVARAALRYRRLML